ncbi:MAG: SAM-dependent methyltransferase [Chloroflexota bacterium]|nr:SAM-dependent methyltransferase [Chloroflexota bacterium]
MCDVVIAPRRTYRDDVMQRKATTADTRLAEGVPELVERIRSEIEAAPEQRITFARFMDVVLTEPGLGYYATSERRPTREGDFLTAPELHPFFGRCIGRQLDEVWQRLERPDPFTVLEYGAGRGMLHDSVLAGLGAEGSPLANVMDWVSVDLPERSRVVPAQPFVGAVLANEYLDALPVHRLQRVGEETMEHWVTWQDGWFATTTGPLSDASLADPLTEVDVTLAEDQIADVSPAWAAFVREASQHLQQGLLLIIDYGHPAGELYGPRRMAGSLLTYRGHEVGGDPFQAVGRQDLTAHVDLTAVERAAETVGLTVMGSTSQAEFLVGLGLGELLTQLGREPGTDPTAYAEARAAVARFLDPRHLGGFRVLGFGRRMEAEPPLRGFSFRMTR